MRASSGHSSREDVTAVPEPMPVPPFRYRLPADVASRIRATAPRTGQLRAVESSAG